MNLFYRLKNLVILSIGMASLWSCSTEKRIDPFDYELEQTLLSHSKGEGLNFFILPESDQFNQIPQDLNNEISAAKVELGKLLFHETGLGIKPVNVVSLKTYSCASCHHAKAGFQAGIAQGIGFGGEGFGLAGEARVIDPNCAPNEIDVQAIRTPTDMNVAYQSNLLWNGQFGAKGINLNTQQAWTANTPKAKNHLGFDGVETQAIAGFGVHKLGIDTVLLSSGFYKVLFAKAFPHLPESDRYTDVNIGLAIAAYERTLLSNRAPFQLWLKGDKDAMTQDQKIGANIFFKEGKCGACHTGPALNAMEFYALAMPDLIGDGIYGSDNTKTEHKGRGGFTGNRADMYKFKVPQLYNLKQVAFLGHGGTFNSVRAIVEYKNLAIKANAAVPDEQLASNFKPLNLTPYQIDKLVDFVENALYDPYLDRYTPSALPSGQCYPNNDKKSKIDMDCY